MKDIRKLQYIDKQYLLNVPTNLVKFFKWHRGDYIELDDNGKDAFIARKAAENTMPKDKVVLDALDRETAELSFLINNEGIKRDPGRLAVCHARLSHIIAKSRKLRHKINTKVR